MPDSDLDVGPMPDPSERWPAPAQRWFRWAPLGLFLLFWGMLWRPRTRPLGTWLLAENHPVEMLTFLALFAGAVLALRLGFGRKKVRPRWASTFFAVLGVGLLLVAMEEIAWGQTFFNFPTPSWMMAVNEQQQLTIHNVKGIQGHNGYLRLAFGLGGLIGIALRRSRRFARIAAPVSLLPWFGVITAFCVFDLYEDFRPMGWHTHWMLLRLQELIEMLIGFAALYYVWVCGRRRDAPAGTPPA